MCLGPLGPLFWCQGWWSTSSNLYHHFTLLKTLILLQFAALFITSATAHPSICLKAMMVFVLLFKIHIRKKNNCRINMPCFPGSKSKHFSAAVGLLNEGLPGVSLAGADRLQACKRHLVLDWHPNQPGTQDLVGQSQKQSSCSGAHHILCYAPWVRQWDYWHLQVQMHPSVSAEPRFQHEALRWAGKAEQRPGERKATSQYSYLTEEAPLAMVRGHMMSPL